MCMYYGSQRTHPHGLQRCTSVALIQQQSGVEAKAQRTGSTLGLQVVRPEPPGAAQMTQCASPGWLCFAKMFLTQQTCGSRRNQ